MFGAPSPFRCERGAVLVRADSVGSMLQAESTRNNRRVALQVVVGVIGAEPVRAVLGAEPACLREAGACYGGARRLVHGVLLADQFALQGL